MCKVKKENQFDNTNAIKYLKILKKHQKIHKKIFGNDKNIETPELLSEYLIRELFSLKKYSGDDKLYDAEKEIEGVTKYYEIKATSSNEGTTTINLRSRPNVLIWAYFDYDNSKICVRIKENFESINYIKELLTDEALARIKTKNDPFENQEKRASITLANVKWDKINEYDMDSLKKKQ